MRVTHFAADNCYRLKASSLSAYSFLFFSPCNVDFCFVLVRQADSAGCSRCNTETLIFDPRRLIFVAARRLQARRSAALHIGTGGGARFASSGCGAPSGSVLRAGAKRSTSVLGTRLALRQVVLVPPTPRCGTRCAVATDSGCGCTSKGTKLKVRCTTMRTTWRA